MKVSPSILAADYLELGKDIKAVANADFIHLDVMDGTFVPNISFGFPVIDALSKITDVPLDAHLMTVHPERWFKRLAEDGVKMVSFHLEASGFRTGKNIDEIHSLGMKAGIAVNPDIPVSKLYRFIGKADFFLVMSVFAGFGGQKFIYNTIDRVAALREEIRRRGADGMIEVDGGVGLDNAAALRGAGTDIIVAGSSVYKSGNAAEAIEALRKA